MYAVKNRYYKHSKLDEERFRLILELFANDITAVECAKKTGVNVRSVNSIYLKLRDRIAQWSESNASGTPGLHASQSEQVEFEKDKKEDIQTSSANYLNSANDGVVGVFLHLMERQVYCALMRDVPTEITIPPKTNEIEGRWREYPIGIDVRRDMRLKIKNATFQSAHKAGDIELIESFGQYLRTRLTKFKGLRREKFYFHLKESEYRYNHRDQDLNALLLGMLGETPIE